MSEVNPEDHSNLTDKNVQQSQKDGSGTAPMTATGSCHQNEAQSSKGSDYPQKEELLSGQGNQKHPDTQAQHKEDDYSDVKKLKHYGPRTLYLGKVIVDHLPMPPKTLASFEQNKKLKHDK